MKTEPREEENRKLKMRIKGHVKVNIVLLKAPRDSVQQCSLVRRSNPRQSVLSNLPAVTVQSRLREKTDPKTSDWNLRSRP